VKVLLFGSTGMVGQGVLRECLRDPEVESVLTVVRKPTGRSEKKVREIVYENFRDFSPVAKELRGFDACFFCVGVSSAGMKEADYRRVTYDFTMAAAGILVRESPNLTFVYVSGAGTDSSEQGRTMWARVKGMTENALLAMPFRAAYMFRPAFIQPGMGITSKTRSYRVFYKLLGPLLPLLKALFPRFVTTTEEVGRAMLEVVRHGAPKRVLENADIVELGRR
jgi:uncharacterized protein YbjT (DUF2867 family)